LKIALQLNYRLILTVDLELELCIIPRIYCVNVIENGL